MDLSPPTKPPRGVKNAKETSGLLMTVMRTLSTSDSNEQRNQERTKLERDYKKSNKLLEELVSIHHNDLIRVMNAFGKLSTLISHSKERVQASKENLLACKKLLTCRREELKKLWFESTEYKYTLQLLNNIKQLKEVPSQVDNYFVQKEFGQGTTTLVNAINISDTTLKNVVGLQELRTELQLKKLEAYAKIVKVMKEQIYTQPANDIIVIKRQGCDQSTMDHHTEGCDQSTMDHHTAPQIQRRERKFSPMQIQFRSKKLLDVFNKGKTQNEESVKLSDDPEFIIKKLIDCIVILDKAVDFLEELKQSTQRELTNLISQTIKVLSGNDFPNMLLELFQILMEQFKHVIECHLIILESFKSKHNINSVYDLRYVWHKMQSLLQPLISEYVEDSNKKKIEVSASENADKTSVEPHDINSYFTRKKQQRTIKGSIFKFDNSPQNDAISKTYDKDSGLEKQLLCKPSSSNITQIYVPVSRFAEEIELQIHGNKDKLSKLSIFMNELISKAFAGKKYEDIMSQLKHADNKNGVTLPTKQTPNSSPSNPLMTVSRKKKRIFKRAMSYFL